MSASCAQGSRARLAMKKGSSPITWSSGATGFPFFAESLKQRKTLGHPNVITGSREEVSERARFGSTYYGGWVVLALNPGHMALVYPWLLGADASGTTFALAETLQTLGVLVDKVTGTHEFKDGVINRAIITGTTSPPGQPPAWIKVALQFLFKGYTLPATAPTYPTLTLAVTGEYVPMVSTDAVLTLAGSARTVKQWTLDINNYVDPRYVNSTDPSTLCPMHRTIKLKTVHPYDSDNADLYDQALAGAAGSLAVTNGTVSITHTFGTLQVPADTPVVPGKVDLNLALDMDARKIGSTPSLSVVIDSTP